jgi:lipoprotein-anchoring transpeptidase ErfK/SrfK
LTAVPATTRLRRVVLAAPVLIGALAACQGERPSLAEDTSTTTTSEPTTTTTAPEPEARVAHANETSIDVYDGEDAATAARQLVSGVDTSEEAIPVVFLVKTYDADADRIEVYLPIEPSGSVGWVEASDVAVTQVAYRIEVHLSDHRLQLFEDDEVLVDEPVGVGDEHRPEPGGVYYLRELLQPPEPDGPYGAYAYGLSGFPTVRAGVDDGTVVGIHGTDDPDSVGDDVSDGSIVLSNEVITRMHEEIGLPLGTPVEVEA